MQPYLGEIRMFAGNFPPAGWAICNGQEVGVNDFEPLFQLIGTTYGGDGLATFAVPDLRGRLPMHFGNGKNLSPRKLADQGGVETVVLSSDEIPNHTHAARASSKAGNSDSPAGHFWAASPKINQFVPAAKTTGVFNEEAIDKGSAATTPLTENLLPPVTTDQRDAARPYDNPNIPNAAGGDGSDIGAFELAAPTAANISVSGRVLTADGRGLKNAVVTITDSSGNARSVKTASLGYYAFGDIEAGETYVVRVSSKQFTFNPQIVTAMEDITKLNLVALE